ncbi:MAG: aldo/keto reductase, partial [Sphaerochaeta sp.]|nr:aldo/keto reductase [Sphaerochaeta sp.]
AGTICFSPLAQGLLTSRYLDGSIPQDSRANEKRFLKPEMITEQRVTLLNKLNAIAQTRNQSLSEMAISWLLRDERVTSVLIGARNKNQLLENLKAVEKPSTFSKEELAAIMAVLKEWE